MRCAGSEADREPEAKEERQVEGLLRLLSGQLGEEEQVEWCLLHLSQCGRCRERVLAELGAESLHDVQQLAGTGWGVELARERSRARQALTPLAKLVAQERWRRIEAEPAFHSWGVAEALLGECRDSWADRPDQARRAAELALRLIEGLDAQAEHVLDLAARGSAYLGNSLRILSDLRGADRALALAEDRRLRGSGDERLAAEILDLKSSLRRDQRLFDEAELAVSQAVRRYLDVGERHLAGRSLLNHATILSVGCQSDRALRTLEAALFLIDRQQEPRLFFLARFTRAQLLLATGRRAEAERVVQEITRDELRHGHPLDRLRWRWFEAQLAIEGGGPIGAEEALREIREEFLARGIGYDAALVSLDLALLYLRQGRMAEVKSLAAELLPIFEARNVRREALAALLLFERAAEAELVTHQLLSEVRSTLETARGLPDWRVLAVVEPSVR